MLIVKFTYNKRGQMIAFRLMFTMMSQRWVRMNTEEAKYLIATGQAEAVIEGSK